METRKKIISENEYEKLLTDKLEILGSGGIFVWIIFLQCAISPVFDGFHISSYTLLGHLPDDQWCEVTALQTKNWTVEEQRNITVANLDRKGCEIWDWNYETINKLNYQEALQFTTQNSNPATVSCRAHGKFQYAAAETTFVADWDLVCDRATYRTLSQMIVSFGKLLGSTLFGMIADKYGRKTSYISGSIIFVVSGFLCTFSPWYILFLIGRFGIGLGSTGFYISSLTIIVENVSLNHRTWMSIAFAFAYPVGMLLLAIVGYFVQPWRSLQLALTIPSLLLLIIS